MISRKDAAFGFMFGVVGGAIIGIAYGQGVRRRATGSVETTFRNGKLNVEVDTVKALTPTLAQRLLPQ